MKHSHLLHPVGTFLHWLNLQWPSPVTAMTCNSIVVHPTTSCSQSLIHAQSPLTHAPSLPLNHPFSWGVHACNYIKNSTDCGLDPRSVIPCHYRSLNLCFHPLRPCKVCTPALWDSIHWSLLHLPSVKSQIWSLTLFWWATRPKGTTVI